MDDSGRWEAFESQKLEEEVHTCRTVVITERNEPKCDTITKG